MSKSSPTATNLRFAISVSLSLLSLPTAAHSDITHTNHTQAQKSTFDTLAPTLAQDITWRRLLLLPDHPTQGNRSTISTPSFFLSHAPQQNPDPHQELMALWQALNDPNQAHKVACRFPARVHWLQSQLPPEQQPNITPCQSFLTWTAAMDTQALSLIFVTEHPNNPAAAFAHTFLKADGKQNATAINYTTPTNRPDGMLGFGIKSITGKYSAVMEIMPFDQKAHHYLSHHQRDLWQYRLRLSTSDIQQMIRHLWEVKDMTRPYYLTHDNCATEILRLIDLVHPTRHLQEQAGKITIPIEITHILQQANLVDEVVFLPSDFSLAQAKHNQSPATKKDNKQNPAYATPIHRLGVFWQYQDNKNTPQTALGLSLHSGYRQPLDRPDGVRQFLDVQTPSITLQYQSHQLKLQNFTLFSMRSYQPKNATQTKKTLATGVHTHLERVIDAGHITNPSPLAIHSVLELGQSWVIGKGQNYDLPNQLCYVFGAGMGQFGKFDKGYRLGVGVNAGCILHLNDRLRLQAELKAPYWYQHQQSSADKRQAYLQPKMTVNAQYDISPHQAWRLTGGYEQLFQNQQSSVQLQYLHYF